MADPTYFAGLARVPRAKRHHAFTAETFPHALCGVEVRPSTATGPFDPGRPNVCHGCVALIPIRTG